MIIKEKEDLLEEVEEKLGQSFEISRDVGPILKEEVELNCLNKILHFYGSLFYMRSKLGDVYTEAGNQQELAELIDEKVDAVRKAHQRLRDRNKITKDSETPLNHKITDIGLKSIKEN